MASLKDLPVLVVDDNQAAREAIVAVLAKLGFQNVTAVGDLPAAAHALATGKAGLVLCEALVGGKYGIQLLKKVRETPQLARVPFLVTSTHKEPAIIQAHMKAGASEFLVKPFDSATLLARLKKALAQRPAPKASAQCTETRLLEMGHKALEGYDAKGAIAYFTKAARANPSCPEAYVGLAMACKHKKDMAQYMVFMNTAAKVMVEQGDMAGAEGIYQELRLYDAQAPNPFAEAAAALGSKGDHATARALLERAVAVEPDNSAHYLALGDTLLRLGDREGARHQVTAALKLKDDFPEARKLFKALTGQRWTESESSQAHARRQEEEEEKRSTVRFWVPDLLVAIKGHDEHFTLSEMSLRSLAFSPMGHTFAVEEELRLDILKLTEDGTRPEVKRLKGVVARMAEDAVGVRLMDPTPEQEQEIKAILTAAQERQKEQFREEKKEVINFDIDMLFM
jgi:two-component system chemotaxis response regulator CheY